MDLEQRFRVPQHGFRLAEHDPADVAGLGREAGEQRCAEDLERLAGLQERLYAERERSLLVVLQGLDAAGKDGTIKHVLGALNPLGVAVTSFGPPTATELAHDFLWRAQLPLPARGRVGVYNRSHYEEVIVVRVHRELLAAQAIDPGRADDPAFWQQRLEDIAAWERHLTRSGTRVLKFFLNISKEEQRRRFLARAQRAEKQWKFSAGDLAERRRWDDFRHAYEEALRATSTAAEPWYVIPADHKWFLRMAVAAILVSHLDAMGPQFPQPSERQLAEIRAALAELQAEG